MAKKESLTHQQKIARGYEPINVVGGVQLYLTPGDLSRIKAGAANRDGLIAYKVNQETERQQGTVEQNAPMVFSITPAGHLRSEQTGNRNWLTLSPAKVRELFSRQAEVLALLDKAKPVADEE